MRNPRIRIAYIIACVLAGLALSFAQTTKPERVRDPVCGLMVFKQAELSAVHNGQTFYFCSKADRDKFKSNPERYTR
jgi:YHS domain-containing protein